MLGSSRRLSGPSRDAPTTNRRYDAFVSGQEPSNDGSAPVQDAASFDDLVALIDEELRAQIAIGRLGDIDPGAPAVHQVASLVADVVLRTYRMEPRVRPDRR
jgi:hypothetical protein